jgi:uncharacterized protein YjfI (DUF2170 family)
MEKGRYWSFPELATALAGAEEVASGRMSVSVVDGSGEGGVMQVTLHDCGDLVVLLGVAGKEIQASVALSPVSAVADGARFQHQLLKANKLLPLSTFGITDIDGEEHYEIFGQLSGGSELDEIVEEIETLGRNALDAAEMIGQWTSGKAAA